MMSQLQLLQMKETERVVIELLLLLKLMKQVCIVYMYM